MITMLDIAEKAGVSRTTVSFVLNGQAVDNRIPEDTRKRILDIASDMGYRRNELARATKMGQSRVLCFLAEAPHLDADFKTRVLAGVLEEASNSGYAVKVQYLPTTSHKVYRETIERCIGWRLAGIIAVNLDKEETLGELYQEMAHYRIAVAAVKDIPPVTQGILVTSNAHQGIRLALEHLMGQGHKHIAFLLGTPETATTTWREPIFRDLMRDFKLPVPDSYIAYGDWWLPEPNERAARQLLCQGKQEGGNPRPTAILCGGDPIALTVLNVARALNIRVPRDLSVVGYGNFTLATYADPPLTTIAEPFHDMGRSAVKQLLTRIANRNDDWNNSPLNEVLPTHMVVRSSTAPPKHPM